MAKTILISESQFLNEFTVNAQGNSSNNINAAVSTAKRECPTADGVTIDPSKFTPQSNDDKIDIDLPNTSNVTSKINSMMNTSPQLKSLANQNKLLFNVKTESKRNIENKRKLYELRKNVKKTFTKKDLNKII